MPSRLSAIGMSGACATWPPLAVVALPPPLVGGGTGAHHPWLFQNKAFPNLVFENKAFPNLVFENKAFPNLVVENKAFPNLVFKNKAFPNLVFPNQNRGPCYLQKCVCLKVEFVK